MKTKRFNTRISALLACLMLVSVLFTQSFSVSVFAEPTDGDTVTTDTADTADTDAVADTDTDVAADGAADADASATDENKDAEDEKKCEHKYAEPEVITEAEGCTDGSQKLICELCGEEKTEVIPAPHNITRIEKDGTCTTKGYITYNCDDCDYTKTEETDLGHKWEVVEKQESDKSGKVIEKCSLCEETRETTCDHDYPTEWTETEGNEATDTKVGTKTKECKKCGNILIENTTAFSRDDMGSVWDFIAVPLGYIVRFFNTANFPYIITLFLFAIVMKVILFPFGIKQQKNMVKQASLRPKEMAIRKKYAGRTDKVTQQKVQQEVMDLYQREHYNPASGCLPLLLQMPILLALFQVVYNPLRHVAALSIKNIQYIVDALTINGHAIKAGYYDLNVLDSLNKLDSARYDKVQETVAELSNGKFELAEKSALPDINMFGVDLARTPMEKMGWYLLIPILTLAIVYLTTILTRKFSYQPNLEGDAKKSGCMMDYVMPLMSAYFALMFPAVLGIYWMFQNILGVLQQMLLKKMYPIPTFTAEEYAAAERELLGKNPKKKKKAGNYQRHPNSLHHVDDDEDEEIVETKKSQQSKKPSEPKASNDLITPAPLKDEETDKDEE